MAGLFNIGAGGKRGALEIDGFRMQSSVYGVPVPIIYGQARVAPNLIHLMDFLATEVHTKSAGSKLLGSSSDTKSYLYTAAVALSLAEGEIAGISKVWRNKDAPVDFAAVYSLAGWSLFTGTGSQSPWSYTTSHHPDEAVPYQFTAYVVAPALELPNATMDSYSFEVLGFLPFGGPDSVIDASPKDILEDYLPNEQYGVGFPADKLGDLTDFGDYCAAAGLFASPVMDSEQPARTYVDELLEIANTGAVWSDGVLKFRPYGDTPLSGNGATFTPDTTPVYDITDNDYLPRADGGAPLRVTRRDPTEVPNVVTVEIEDRSYDYNRVPVKAEEQDAQLTDGQRPLPVLSLHAIKDTAVGRTVAQMRLQREQNIRNSYDFLLGVKYSLLEPMDLVTLTDPGLGMDLEPVRLVSIEELDDERGFAVIAEDWPFGTATASLYGSQGANGYAPDADADPGDTSAFITTAPLDIQVSPLDLYIGATGGDDWGGCDVYVSLDDVTYQFVARIGARAAFGETTASLATAAAYPSTDVGNTLSVLLTGSTERTIDSVAAAAFNALAPLCRVEDEWLAFQDAALTGAGAYDLTTLYRGLYSSTIPASHPSASDFLFVDDAVLKFACPFTNVAVGTVLYFKLPAFNKFGAALQDIGDVTAVPYTLERGPQFFPPGTNSVLTIDPGFADLGASTLEVTFALSNPPLGTITYNVAYTISGGSQDSVAGISSSPYTFSGVTFFGAPGSGAIYVDAFLNGVLFLSAKRMKNFVT